MVRLVTTGGHRRAHLRREPERSQGLSRQPAPRVFQGTRVRPRSHGPLAKDADALAHFQAETRVERSISTRIPWNEGTGTEHACDGAAGTKPWAASCASSLTFLADFVSFRQRPTPSAACPTWLPGAATSPPASDTTPPFASKHPRRCG